MSDYTPTSASEPDWLDAPAVFARCGYCSHEDYGLQITLHGSVLDGQKWDCAECQTTTDWNALSHVTPLYPKEGAGRMSHDEIIEQGEPDLEELTTIMRNSYIALGLRESLPSEYGEIYEDRCKTFDNWINRLKEQVWDEAYELGWDEADYYHKQAPGDPLKPATPNPFRT